MVRGESSTRIPGKNIKLVNGSIRSIFMHADKVDMCLMALGFIGAVFDGFTDRLPLLFTSHMINSIGSSSKLDHDAFQHNINKVSLSLSLSSNKFFLTISS